jgi:peptidoglycan/LPS O-acetylase OafA/YrhL
MTPKYRPDIDGLRAVAVLSVLFFHLGSGVFSGGYVGVDIFFVISGYLITTIIIREIGAGEFSVAGFYERRFRRILPALLTVTVVTLALGVVLLDPESLENLGKSAAATALFSSNILFYSQTGYFDTAAELKPLLHTWSLAVEEQYYIFFPLLLLLIARVDTRHYLRWILILGLLSFVGSVLVTWSNSSAAFYLIPTRAWELFMGSLLALHLLPTPDRQMLREAVATIGLVLIAYAIFFFNSETVFPGSAAFVPTLGSAMLIYAGTGGHSVVSRLLSRRSVVFIGLISYSLYLWHWPVIAFSRIYFITEIPGPVYPVMLITMLLLAILSWRFIETPFRKRAWLAERQPMLWGSVAGSLAIVAAGLVLILSGGLPKRYTDAYAGNLREDPAWERWDECEDIAKHAGGSDSLCKMGISGGDPRFALWGDSQAQSLAPGLDLQAREHGITGIIATKAACPPLLGIERPDRKSSCHEFNQRVLDIIANTPTIDTVILSSRWALAATGTRYKGESGEKVRLADAVSPENNTLSNAELFALGLERSVGALQDLGKKVVIVSAIPEIGFDVPSAHFVTRITNRDLESLISPTIREYGDRNAQAIAQFEKLRDEALVEVVRPETYLCNRDYCRVTANGMPLYRDDDHLSVYGSEYVAPSFNEVLQQLAIPPQRSSGASG